MNNPEIIPNTIAFVKQQLENAEGGHDWFHIQRVYNNTMLIARHEEVDLLIAQLGALLHDIADSKFHNGDESIGPGVARAFLEGQNISERVTEHVVQIIKNISFKGSYETKSFRSRELDVVQDADRLDAIGAIGIARAFNYGGFKNRELHNPDIPPIRYETKEEYKKSTAPTINHFYEKLLLLKDMMNTETGKRIALERHRYMEGFLEQFYGEWNGEK
ncbi:HD domain-containing protein [Sinomicrobium sp. M5D2P9]